MKLNIERAALLKSLAHVQSVVEKRNTIPILANVLLEATENALGLTATDMDLTIVEHAEAQVGAAGALTVAAHTLFEIVRKLPDGSQISLSGLGESERLTLRAGRSTFSLATLPKEDFPDAAEAEFTHSFSMAVGELRNLIDRTRFAISTEETRYYLNGIFVHASQSGEVPMLRAVATDGHRLARFEMPLPEGAAGMPGVIVPRKTVNELRKLCEESDESVVIYLSPTRARFILGATTLTSKLIDGTFPDYERVIPVGNDKVMEVDCKSFSAAVDRVSTISTDKTRAIKLSVNSGSLTLSAASPDSGAAEEEIEVGFDGEAIEIGFNSRYLLDVTQQIQGDGAQFNMADATSPTVVRDLTDSSALYVLMPMRV